MNINNDIREDFLLCISVAKLRLRNLPNFIFLCGGSTERTPQSEVENERTPERYQSMRKAIYDIASDKLPLFYKKIVLAEFYQDWFEHGMVKNLIDFEMAIADMAGSIVLILEAPGAYAELGSFSVLETLAEKLILVVNENTITPDTYISLGPIKYLEDNSRIVLRYKWIAQYIVKGVERDQLGTLLHGNVADIHQKAEFIAQEIDKKSTEISMVNPIIDLKRNGHVCFIIADLIYNFGALKIHEIVSYLKYNFEVKNASISMVRSCIYILVSFEFITKISQGDVYYVPTTNNTGFIKYSYENEDRKQVGFKNISEIRDHQLMFYAISDPARFAAIEENNKWK
jgi:hypothetical protein